MKCSFFSLVLLVVGQAAIGQMVFSPAVNYAVGDQPEGGTLLDFTGDGRLDLIVTTEQNDKIEFLANLGNGTFGAPVSLVVGNGSNPEGIVAGDFDGDLDVDLLVVLQGTNQVRLVLNGGAGVFSLGATFGVGVEPGIVVAADFNGDGSLDAAVNNRTSGTMSVLLNDGVGGFLAAVHYAVGVETRCIAAGDITNDGLPDLAVTSRDDRLIRVFRNLGGGSFNTLINLSMGNFLEPQGIDLADFDSDGKFDIVTASEGMENQQHVSVFLQDNFGTPWVGPINGNTGGMAPTAVATADFDLDGHVDCAATDADSNDVSLKKNGGIGIFFLPVVVPVGQDPRALVLLTGDLDGDGDHDLVALNRESDDVSVLINQILVCQPDLGFGGPGSAILSVCGDALATGGSADLLLTGAAPSAQAYGVVSSVLSPTPLFNAILAPNPIETLYPFTTSASGQIFVPGILGGGGPFSLYVQFGIVDPTQAFGFALSNALRVDFLP
jgi:FG-GAP-like repeat